MRKRKAKPIAKTIAEKPEPLVTEVVKTSKSDCKICISHGCSNYAVKDGLCMTCRRCLGKE